MGFDVIITKAISLLDQLTGFVPQSHEAAVMAIHDLQQIARQVFALLNNPAVTAAEVQSIQIFSTRFTEQSERLNKFTQLGIANEKLQELMRIDV